MYFYKIGYTSYEDSGSKQLSHWKRFSREEFENIIKECTVLAVKELWDTEIEFQREMFKNREWYDFDRPYVELSFDKLCPIVAKYMCEQYGFEKINYTQVYYGWGWGDLLDPSDCLGEEDKDVIKLSQYLCEQLPEYIHNKAEYCKKREVKENE